MKMLWFAVAILAPLSAFGQSKPPSADSDTVEFNDGQDATEQQLAEAIAEHVESKQQALERLIRSIEKHQTSATAKGDLESVQKCRSAIEAIREGNTLPNDPEFANSRTQADKSIAKADKKLMSAYDSAIRLYTRSKEYDKAEELLRLKTALQKSATGANNETNTPADHPTAKAIVAEGLATYKKLGTVSARIKRPPSIAYAQDKSLGEVQRIGGTALPEGRACFMPGRDGQIIICDTKTKSLRAIASPQINTPGPFFGAVYVPTKSGGFVYGIPHQHRQYMKFNPITEVISFFGETPRSESFWGGVLGADGRIYCIPSHADRVHRITPSTDTVDPIGESLGAGGYKYAGGAMGPNGYIYGFPDNARRILKIDTRSETTSLVGPDLGPGPNKCFSAVLAPNGRLYGGPGNRDHVLVFDPATETTKTVGGIPALAYNNLALGPDGRIYLIPRNPTATQIAVLDPSRDTIELLRHPLPPNKAEISSLILTSEGVVVGVPSNLKQTLFIDFGVPVPESIALSPFLNHN